MFIQQFQDIANIYQIAVQENLWIDYESSLKH